jgi:hypothetical protein
MQVFHASSQFDDAFAAGFIVRPRRTIPGRFAVLKRRPAPRASPRIRPSGIQAGDGRTAAPKNNQKNCGLSKARR